MGDCGVSIRNGNTAFCFLFFPGGVAASYFTHTPCASPSSFCVVDATSFCRLRSPSAQVWFVTAGRWPSSTHLV
eukprot:5497124-Pyramimonas_sp.AAC.1